jgi:SAM-dependent methyltransferase
VAIRPTALTTGDHPPCPICQAASEQWATTSDVEYRTSDEVWTYSRCPRCHTLFLDQPPEDRLGEIYPFDYYSYVTDHSLAFRLKERLDRRTLRAICSRVRGDRLRVLDVGGGTGAMAAIVRRIEPRVSESVVVDLDERAAAPAEAAGHRFVTSRVEDFHEDEGFDVILLLNLVEHVSDPGSVLAGVRRLTNPGGRVLVKTPNVESMDARVLRHHDWGGYHAPRHWVLFTPETFRLVAQRAGFVVDRISLTQGGPFWAVGIMSILERRGLLRRTPGQAMVRHWLYGPLAAGLGVFDLLRARIGGRTSQMFVELRCAAEGD